MSDKGYKRNWRGFGGDPFFGYFGLGLGHHDGGRCPFLAAHGRGLGHGGGHCPFLAAHSKAVGHGGGHCPFLAVHSHVGQGGGHCPFLAAHSNVAGSDHCPFLAAHTRGSGYGGGYNPLLAGFSNWFGGGAEKYPFLRSFCYPWGKGKGKGDFKVTLKVADYSLDELDIKVLGQEVTVHGKHDGPDETKEFTRHFTLPENIDPETVAASLSADQELIVTANKKVPEGEPRAVTIQVGGGGSGDD
ncbi:uncharacterized protein LOC110981545 [Acanthaster planci]|uniref:Uncharacterized protein LOC110981545 n=1 Tax=Acanthaster planci TaxID=133434 RepID=A0A8B7YQX6_ACAPL|nr:uncharacterized protein LOC110981545 [Acanthaster planci]